VQRWVTITWISNRVINFGTESRYPVFAANHYEEMLRFTVIPITVEIQ